ncbi:CRISPR-associated helicase Cas3' [Nocardiopsis kunsanensis]|nr:CRISPR-associated helicase Cas3' [Nocardiopsis kunsanensis]
MGTPHGHDGPLGLLDLSLWGKSEGLPPNVRYPLTCHLLDVGAVAEVLWRDHVASGVRQTIADGLETTIEHAGRLIPYWASLHDIGKITHGFQAKDVAAPLHRYPDSGPGKNHGQVAGEWLQYLLPEYGYAAEGKGAPALMAAQLLGGHHGSFHQLAESVSAAPLRSLGYPEDAWEEQRRLHLAELTELFGSPAPPSRIDGAVAALVCGLVIQADWLASQLSFVGRQIAAGLPAKAADLPEFLDRARDRAPGLLEQAGLGRPAARSASFASAFPHIENPNGLQRSIAKHLPELCGGPGMLLITAPTGEGKTETALYAAEVMGQAAGRSGLYVALPTMATADQMYTRVNEYLNRRVTAPSSMSLLHGMAWLNPDYSSPTSPSSGGQNSSSHTQGAAESHRAVEISEWLQGRKRGLFADFAAGTIDQALMAALRSRHNMVRLLGLSGKTVIIDEVHAADAYMLALVTRLLNWLGRLQVPVILLSATLHHRTARVLTEAYLKGAGRRRGAEPVPEVRYPGWAYAGVEAPHTVTVNPEPLETTPRKPLTVQCREMPLTGEESTHLDSAVREELADLVENGGCAAVIRTTVAEAQRTFADLAEWSAAHAQELGAEPPELHLLHARFPADQRERITRQITWCFGKDGAQAGDRPRAAILVATAIIEQSIDIDLDLMISDLAPIHLLLQRSGRCWRHEHRGIVQRPSWADAPRLVVLAPSEADSEKAIPRVWGYIHHPSLLLRTHNLLRRRQERPVRVPEDVQELVDGMIDDDELNLELPDQDLDRQAADMAHSQLGNNAAIPLPRGVTRDLHQLTDHDLDEAQVATRFGADSARVVCCYTGPEGERWLDAALSERLPSEGELSGGRFTEEQVRAVLSRSLPVPGNWLQGHEEQVAPPEAWQFNPHLRHVQVLVHRVGTEGDVQGPQLGKRRVRLDGRVGLLDEG